MTEIQHKKKNYNLNKVGELGTDIPKVIMARHITIILYRTKEKGIIIKLSRE